MKMNLAHREWLIRHGSSDLERMPSCGCRECSRRRALTMGPGPEGSERLPGFGRSLERADRDLGLSFIRTVPATGFGPGPRFEPAGLRQSEVMQALRCWVPRETTRF
jgi:hypothetical protein